MVLFPYEMLWNVRFIALVAEHITNQGSKSCAKARRTFDKKFGLRRIFQALTYAIKSRYKHLLRFMHFLGIFLQKKCFLGQKQCFPGKRCTITWYILHIILSQFCKFAISFVAKIVNTRLTKIFMAIFALAERLPTSTTLA